MLRFDESETTTSCAKVLVGGVANLATAVNSKSPALNASQQQATSNGQTTHQEKNRDGRTNEVFKNRKKAPIYFESLIFPGVNARVTPGNYLQA